MELTQSRLRLALSQHFDERLTPEVCAHIEAIVFDSSDRSIRTDQFEPMEFRGYVIAVESFKAALIELHELHERHWHETEKHRAGLPFNPNYAEFLRMERAGKLVQFTIRKGGALVGNLRMWLGVSLHTGTYFADTKPGAEEDTLYIAPEHRGHFLLPLTLLRYAERVLISLGMVEIRADSKALNRADVLLRRMGYQLVAYKFVKIFVGDEYGKD